MGYRLSRERERGYKGVPGGTDEVERERKKDKKEDEKVKMGKVALQEWQRFDMWCVKS